MLAMVHFSSALFQKTGIFLFFSFVAFGKFLRRNTVGCKDKIESLFPVWAGRNILNKNTEDEKREDGYAEKSGYSVHGSKI